MSRGLSRSTTINMCLSNDRPASDKITANKRAIYQQDMCVLSKYFDIDVLIYADFAHAGTYSECSDRLIY